MELPDKPYARLLSTIQRVRHTFSRTRTGAIKVPRIAQSYIRTAMAFSKLGAKLEHIFSRTTRRAIRADKPKQPHLYNVLPETMASR